MTTINRKPRARSERFATVCFSSGQPPPMERLTKNVGIERGENTMTDHPLLRELRDALLGLGDLMRVRAHLAECLACRVRMARIAQADGLQTPTPNVVQRIVDASTVVPGATNI